MSSCRMCGVISGVGRSVDGGRNGRGVSGSGVRCRSGYGGSLSEGKWHGGVMGISRLTMLERAIVEEVSRLS